MQGGISVLKAVDLYLRKFRLKSGAAQVDLAKAADVAVDLHDTVHLYLSTVQRDPIRNTNVRYMYIVLL